jgi:hypothetical protein
VSQEALERTAMEWLLAGHHPVLEMLRAQYAVAEVTRRELTGVGCFVSFHVPADAPRAAVGKSVVIEDVAFGLEGSEYGAGALLFLSDGELDLLELVMWAGDWPDDPRLTGIHYLTHVPTGDGHLLEPATERDWPHLLRRLSND